MNKKELETLVDHELITQVGYANDLLQNPDKLEAISLEDMVATGVLSQPEANKSIVDNGVDILIPITTQEDFISRMKVGKLIKLTNDLHLDTCIIIDEGDVCNVDLNGYTITAGVFAESNGKVSEGDSDSYVFWNKGGNLSISSDGTIKAQDANYSMAVWTQAGTTTLNGGTYLNGGEGSDLIYASGTGSVVINGGYYEAGVKQNGVDGTANIRAALNVKDADYKKGTAKIEVFGGSFLEFDPSNNVSEGESTNYVAEGFKTIVTENIYNVIPA